MSFADFVLGHREPKRARSDLVCGITAARLTFESELGLTVQAAAIAFDPPEKSGLATIASGLGELLASLAEDTGAMLAWRDDAFGFRWITLSGASPDDLAISISVLAEAFDQASCWEHLVCAVFSFERRRRSSDPRVYWIYNFASGSFYAFVPRSSRHRDTKEELRLHAAVEHDLRVEPDPQRRYPLWDTPLLG
jgi:hypothetical protein